MGLSDKETEVIDEVITNTRLLTWNQLINYVYATPPIREGKEAHMLKFRRI
ncbi:SocA family protein [Peptoniphilus porci]|uniref:SocA family protein n=1 Tax=Peptoniphilus porci TaxID=2652280 RepID=UPI001F295C92|nr:SocA family protein [Peptoniphilus porci]